MRFAGLTLAVSLAAPCAPCLGLSLSVSRGGAHDAFDEASTFDEDPPAEFPYPYVFGVSQRRPDNPWMPDVPPGPECHSDADCAIDSDVNFRCKQVQGLELSETNTCRTPGRGAATNVSCMCVHIPCGPAATQPQDASKPQYLMIGDCTTSMILKRIEPVMEAYGWELTKVPGNAASTNKGAHCLDGWLNNKAIIDPYPPHLLINRSWNVISFNFGMHDMARHSERLTLDQYRHLLSNITSKLVAEQRRSGTKLLWVNLPPVSNAMFSDMQCATWSKFVNTRGGKICNMARRNSDVVAYNEVAAEVMQRFNDAGAHIKIVDMYSHMLGLCGGQPYELCEKYQLAYDAHFTVEGFDAIANKYKAALADVHADMNTGR